MQAPRHILVTGASSGIGAALAVHYAAAGTVLFLSGRDEVRLQEVAQSCRNKGAQVETIILDVLNKEKMAQWIGDADRRHPLDLVVANAGISGGTGGADSESFAQVRMIFDINLTGVLNTIEPVLPLMRARGRGQIALMSSLASFSGWPGAPAYAASKGAVRIYGEGLRGALAAEGVRVSVLCPGFIRTPMTAVNDYPMPFLMDVGRAAVIIAEGLARNRARIAFPWGTYMLAGLIGMLPAGLASLLLRRLPAKPALTSPGSSFK